MGLQTATWSVRYRPGSILDTSTAAPAITPSFRPCARLACPPPSPGLVLMQDRRCFSIFFQLASSPMSPLVLSLKAHGGEKNKPNVTGLQKLIRDTKGYPSISFFSSALYAYTGNPKPGYADHTSPDSSRAYNSKFLSLPAHSPQAGFGASFVSNLVHGDHIPCQVDD